jgi:Domain of unknown function (DUF4082)
VRISHRVKPDCAELSPRHVRNTTVLDLREWRPVPAQRPGRSVSLLAGAHTVSADADCLGLRPGPIWSRHLCPHPPFFRCQRDRAHLLDPAVSEERAVFSTNRTAFSATALSNAGQGNQTPITLGVRFWSSQSSTVSTIRFYRSTASPLGYVARLYSASARRPVRRQWRMSRVRCWAGRWPPSLHQFRSHQAPLMWRPIPPI